VGSILGQGMSLFSNSKKNVRGQVGGALYVSKLTTDNNKLAWIAICLYHNVSEKSLFLLVGKKCFSECGRAGRELTTIIELGTSTDALAH
jgi:hypothetical protein